MERAATQDLLERLWAEAQPTLTARPRPPRPLLVVLAGPPLSGKTTLARALAEEAPAALLHVENDAVRARLAQGQPTHGPGENHLTYRASWALAQRAIEAGCHALHDGTNLTEQGRRGAYRAADSALAPAVVVFVDTPAGVQRARAEAGGPQRLAAWEQLGHRRPALRATRPHATVDGTRPLEELVAQLRALPALAPLWELPTG